MPTKAQLTEENIRLRAHIAILEADGTHDLSSATHAVNLRIALGSDSDNLSDLVDEAVEALRVAEIRDLQIDNSPAESLLDLLETYELVAGAFGPEPFAAIHTALWRAGLVSESSSYADDLRCVADGLGI